MHRHHGVLRILVLVLVVAAVVVAIVLFRQHRAQRTEVRDSADGMPPSPTTSVTAAGAVAAPSPASPSPAPTTAALATDLVQPDRFVPRPTPPTRHRGGAPIVAVGLTKRYGDKLAVDHLSFEVREGRVTGFLGPNGAGKSTTMRMVMGLDHPNEGTVTIGGTPFHDLAWPLRQVGALLEAKAVHPGRSAYAHLRMLAQTNDIPTRRVEEVLELVGLTSVAHQRAGGFSLGMGQRLGIAVALLGDPEVVLFDEPVNGLDLDGIRWVRGLLRALAGEGRTVFVSSHLMSEMSLTADDLIVIGRGRLIAQQGIAEFIEHNSRRWVRVRSPELERLRGALEAAGATITASADGLDVSGLDAEGIGRLTLRESIVLTELTTQTASLEEAFLESTEGEVEYRVDHSDAGSKR